MENTEKKAEAALAAALVVLGATVEEAKAILDGAYAAADPDDVLRDPERYASDELAILREEE